MLKRNKSVPKYLRDGLTFRQEFVRSRPGLRCVHLRAAWPATTTTKAIDQVSPLIRFANVFAPLYLRCPLLEYSVNVAGAGEHPRRYERRRRRAPDGIIGRRGFGKRSSCWLVTIESTTCARFRSLNGRYFIRERERERKRRHSASRKGSNQPLLTAPGVDTSRETGPSRISPFNRGSSIAIFTLHMR